MFRIKSRFAWWPKYIWAWYEEDCRTHYTAWLRLFYEIEYLNEEARWRRHAGTFYSYEQAYKALTTIIIANCGKQLIEQEFANWIHEHCIVMGSRWITNYAGNGGKLFTIEELHVEYKRIMSECHREDMYPYRM